MSPRAKGAGIKISVALVKCGRCKKRYSNPLTHVCVTQMGSRPAKTKVGPSLAIKCGNCKKPLGNPLTHVCREKTDFKKRKAAAAKAAKKPQTRTGTAHEYTSCRDPDCSKYPCKVYKEGHSDGEIEGFQLGHAAGFADGIASCPGPHGGG